MGGKEKQATPVPVAVTRKISVRASGTFLNRETMMYHRIGGRAADVIAEGT
jgi:hypothetical protein